MPRQSSALSRTGVAAPSFAQAGNFCFGLAKEFLVAFHQSIMFSLVIIASTACGGAAHNESMHAPPTTNGTANGAKAPGEAKMGDQTTCPVTGEAFTVTEASPKAEVDGKTYYFCCAGCDQKFKADPAKYLKPSKT